MPKLRTRSAPRQAPRVGAGRKPIPLPFRDMADEIVGKVGKDGRPVAAVYAFTASTPAELATLKNRYRRRLTLVGKQMRPDNPYVFPMAIEQLSPGSYELLFWDRDAGR